MLGFTRGFYRCIRQILDNAWISPEITIPSRGKITDNNIGLDRKIH